MYHIFWLWCALAIDVVTGGVTVMLLITDAETDVATDRAPQVVLVSGGCALVGGVGGPPQLTLCVTFSVRGLCRMYFCLLQIPILFFC
jgi:hypothetical protein